MSQPHPNPDLTEHELSTPSSLRLQSCNLSTHLDVKITWDRACGLYALTNCMANFKYAAEGSLTAHHDVT